MHGPAASIRSPAFLSNEACFAIPCSIMPDFTDQPHGVQYFVKGTWLSFVHQALSTSPGLSWLACYHCDGVILSPLCFCSLPPRLRRIKDLQSNAEISSP